jgi:serine/threonine-protein kinase
VQGPTYAERSYIVHGEFATGGMATVHFGRAMSSAGFGRVVAVKKLHRHLAKDSKFLDLFLDEARLAVRIQHANVVGVVDVVAREGEVFLVMEYVHGVSLSSLLTRTKENDDTVDVSIAASVIGGALQGLHAAHVAKSETGAPLHIVHRDVSPQNILVGVDGVTRVLDFGVARAAGQSHLTRTGELKGKLAYMAPEQIEGSSVDRRSDIYAAGVVLWEMLTGRRLFAGENEGTVMAQVVKGTIPAPSTLNPSVSADLDRIVMTALARDPAKRFPTAREMATAVEALGVSAGALSVGDWVHDLANDVLATRAETVAGIEAQLTPTAAPSVEPVPPRQVLSVDEDTRTTEVRFASEPPRSALRSPSKRRWGLGLAIVGAAGVLVTLGIASVRMRASHATVAIEPPTTASSVTPATASAPPPTVQGSPDAADIPTVASSAPPSAAARSAQNGSSRVGTPTAKTVRSPTSAVHGGRAPSAATKAPADCNPPYTMVAGVKVPKPECPLD